MQYRLLPLHHAFDESAPAFACRYARRINLPLRFWCTDLGISRYDVIRGHPEAVVRIAELADVDPAVLMASTITHQHDRDYTLNGQSLTRGSLRRTRLRGCASCMKAQFNNGPVWHVSVQTSWCLASILTCPIHCEALTDIGSGKDAMFNEWSLMIEDFLSSPLAEQRPAERNPGQFESYLLDRVRHGSPASGGEVNDLPFHVAANLVPVIGQTLIYGTTAAPPTSDEEAIKAADVGFSALRERGGLENALAHIDAAAGPRHSNQGPQNRLGRHLFGWLSRRASLEGHEKTRERVREFILDTMPVDRGTMLLGRPVDTSRVHNIATLKVVTGLHPTTLRSYLKDNGMLKTDRHLGDVPMPAEEVEAWASRMQEVVGLKALDDYLGCSRSHRLTLEKVGLIKPMFAASISRRHRFQRSTLDHLLSSLLDRAMRTETTPSGYAGLDQIGKRANCSVSEVLKAVIDGEFKGVACRPANRRIDGLEFDVDEAKKVTRGDPLPGLTANDLTNYWKLPYAAVKALIEGGHLATIRARHPVHKGHVRVVPYDAIERFEQMYVHIRDLPRILGISRSEVRDRLSVNQWPLAFDPMEIEAPLYRRADIGA